MSTNCIEMNEEVCKELIVVVVDPSREAKDILDIYPDEKSLRSRMVNASKYMTEIHNCKDDSELCLSFSKDTARMIQEQVYGEINEAELNDPNFKMLGMNVILDEGDSNITFDIKKVVY